MTIGCENTASSIVGSKPIVGVCIPSLQLYLNSTEKATIDRRKNTFKQSTGDSGLKHHCKLNCRCTDHVPTDYMVIILYNG